MELIYGFLYMFVLFVSGFWFFSSLCECKNEKGWLFALKRQLALCWISMRKSSSSKVCSYSDAMSQLIDGVQEQKYDLDTLTYYGLDEKKNHIFIKISRRKNKSTEIILFIGLKDGSTYELPDHPNTVINDSFGWSATDLKIITLESTRRTRIIFNGLLRKGHRSNIDDDIDCNIEHVRFNCIFTAITPPTSRDEFWSSNLQAEALSRNLWKQSKWEQLLNELDHREIDQIGSLMGEITFEDSSRVEIFLHSLRKYNSRNGDATLFEENIYIIGFNGLGHFFCVNASGMKNDFKNIKMGYMKNSVDNLCPMKSLNFNINEFIKRHENGFNEYAFQFTVEKRKCEAIMKLDTNTRRIHYSGYPWDTQYVHYNFELKLNDDSGFGMMQLYRAYSGSCPVTLSPIDRFIKTKRSIENSEVYILPFQDERCQNESLVGGKGASLGELTSIKNEQYTVPNGFCVTAYALESHIKQHANINDAIDEFVKICSNGNVDLLKEHSKKVVTLLENTPVLHAVQVEVLEALKQLEIDGQKNTYAVRSSAVGEDSEDTSAAGQNSTFLGIENSEVVKNIARCWASLYTHRSAEYRRQNGLPVKAAMGVCVQQMVNAESAGVMFTRHPITRNPKEILITSNYGLGEAVVSALVDPDTIIIQRSLKNSLTIKSSTIGKKSKKIAIDDKSGGTRQLELSIEETSKLSVNTELAIKLAEIGVSLDRLYEAPRDIEWAIVGGRVYLLQCRPVTAIDAWTDFEITHEFDTKVPFKSDIFTLANVGEVLVKPVTPLTISTVIYALNVSNYCLIKKFFNMKTYKSVISIFNNKCTLNYMNTILRYLEDQISGQIVVEIAICGHSIITPEIYEIAKKRNGTLSLIQRLKIRLEVFAYLWKNSRIVEETRKIVERCKNLPLIQDLERSNSSQQLYPQFFELIEKCTMTSYSHSYTSRSCIFYQALVMAVLTEGNENLTIEHYSDIALLLGSCSNVISAQVPIVLKEIMLMIKKSGLSDDFKNLDLSNAMDWLELKCPKIYDKVQNFIKIHGYRGTDEFDLITETWGMKPEKFLATIQSMLDINSDESSNALTKELTPSETVAQLKTPRKSVTRWIIRAFLPYVRQAVACREETKSLLIKVIHYLRLAYRKLAVTLKTEGKLPDEELIFFLTHKEIGEIIAESCPALIRKAIRRRRLRPKLMAHKYREVNFGMPKPLEDVQTSASTDIGAHIQGTTVCNGIVTGRACVAVTFEEAAKIQSGDILITTATDIGWSLYFPLLGGVVTEIGGLISHGAVIARENGLPCIVSAKNATKIVKTGEIVRLNGYKGTLEIIK